MVVPLCALVGTVPLPESVHHILGVALCGQLPKLYLLLPINVAHSACPRLVLRQSRGILFSKPLRFNNLRRIEELLLMASWLSIPI